MNTLVIMVKAPVMGAVKTRLAREVGAAEALRAYRAIMGHVIARIGIDPRWRTVLAVAPDALTLSARWPARLDRIAQGSGDLGQRMQRVFDRFRGDGPVVIVGSDIPGIARHHIAKAFQALGAHDAVIGPADDGGYWLIGVGVKRRLMPFRDVRWSSPHTMVDTVRGFSGAKVAIISTLMDVDNAADWRAWRSIPASSWIKGT